VPGLPLARRRLETLFNPRIDVRLDMGDEQRRDTEGFFFLGAYIACIPLANWMIGHVGTECAPQGPCVVPVAPGLMAPSGVLLVGLALVLRDLVQRRLGIRYALGAIAVGAALSGVLAPLPLVVASTVAFLLSELADFAVFTPLQKRGLILAVLISSVVGLIADSIIFLWLAFGSLDFLTGQIVGKTWMVLLTLPAIEWLRRRDQRDEGLA
jgi:queuosine precursor transporter